jgi:transcriptional regulator with XRE-family HTH domain
MSRAAVGAYFARLRQEKKWTRARLLEELAELTNEETSESQILRIERGEQATRNSLQSALITALNGNAGQVQQLLTNKNATRADGERAAEEWLRFAVSETRDLVAIIQAMPPDQQRDAVHHLTRLSALLQQGLSLSDALRVAGLDEDPPRSDERAPA